MLRPSDFMYMYNDVATVHSHLMITNHSKFHVGYFYLRLSRINSEGSNSVESRKTTML